MLVHGNGVLQWTAIEESTEDEVGYGIKKVVIQEGITEISAGCFSGDFTVMTELKGITFGAFRNSNIDNNKIILAVIEKVWRNKQKMHLDINNNPLTKRAERRYASFTEKQRRQIEILNDMTWKEYQLNVIKKTKTLPRKGDVFLVSPQSKCFFWGVVVQEQVYHMEDENFWLVFILKDRTSNVSFNVPKLNIENLLIEPAMVAQFFWNSGVFFNVGKIEIPSELDYGFYRIGKGYVDEYGRALEQEPKWMGTYGVSSKDGLAYEINYELIANNIFERDDDFDID